LLSGNGIDSPVPSTMSAAMPRRTAKTRRHPPERGHRLHGGDRGHRGRQKLQVGPRPETDYQQAAGRMCDRRLPISVVEKPVEEGLTEPIYIGEQRIIARYRLPRSIWNGGYSSLINETYTATR
jgi:hypothetical protein